MATELIVTRKMSYCPAETTELFQRNWPRDTPSNQLCRLGKGPFQKKDPTLAEVTVLIWLSKPGSTMMQMTILRTLAGGIVEIPSYPKTRFPTLSSTSNETAIIVLLRKSSPYKKKKKKSEKEKSKTKEKASSQSGDHERSDAADWQYESCRRCTNVPSRRCRRRTKRVCLSCSPQPRPFRARKSGYRAYRGILREEKENLSNRRSRSLPSLPKHDKTCKGTAATQQQTKHRPLSCALDFYQKIRKRKKKKKKKKKQKTQIKRAETRRESTNSKAKLKTHSLGAKRSPEKKKKTRLKKKKKRSTKKKRQDRATEGSQRGKGKNAREKIEEIKPFACGKKN